MCARPLFLTRKFPPSVGGMETLASGVWRTLSATVPDAVLIAHGGSNRALPRWLPGALARTVRLVRVRRVDFVLTGDALMYAVAAPLLRLLRVRSATMVMGLDLTFANQVYRGVVHRAIRNADAVLAISEATAAVAREFGVPPTRVHVVRLGVDAPHVTPAERVAARRRINEQLATTDGQVVVLSLGRLVRRKGVEWFVRNVLPSLPGNVVYVIAGDGEDVARVRATIAELGLAGRVRLPGQVDDTERELLLQGADLFVQPNIRVPGDMEGFGLVTIEAAMRGCPVVAADLEGIADAVADGVTGWLLPSGDDASWRRELAVLVADRETLAERGRTFQSAARERYSEQRMGEQLVRLLGLDSLSVPPL